MLSNIPDLGEAFQDGFGRRHAGDSVEGLQLLGHRPTVLIADIGEAMAHLVDHTQLHLIQETIDRNPHSMISYYKAEEVCKVLFGKKFNKIQVKTNGAEIHLVQGGSGSPLLLLHGYPQTHVIWHKVAPRLVNRFHLICPDLRGYGDSSKPTSTPDHYPYSKRAMAQDMVEVMASLGYQAFFVAGHDRGARVTHRLALDYPEKIKRACVMDIVPTYHMFKTADQHFATGYYHWFFLIQPDGLPEHLIGADPTYYLTEKLKRWGAPGAKFADEAVAEYLRCFSQPEAIHASCEDYRAAASIDLKHDEQDRNKKIRCPLLVLWGAKGFVHRTYDVLGVWREWAEEVEGKALDCGHFLPEEAPATVGEELLRFFNDN